MQQFALQVVSDAGGLFQWHIWHRHGVAEACMPFLHSRAEYPSFKSALDAGGIVLARACGQRHGEQDEQVDREARNLGVDYSAEPPP